MRDGATVYRRVTVAPLDVGEGYKGRILLELDDLDCSPVARAFALHIDKVRTLLLMGAISPDDAYGLLQRVDWLREFNRERKTA